MSLTPCSSCARHVRRSELACPFCGASLSLEVAPTSRTTAERLGRAAIFSFGAALVTTASGCGSLVAAYGAPAPDTGMPDTGIVQDAGTDGGPMTLYGGPPQDAGVDMGGASADYGAPPPPDSGA